ncbi:MAG: hypothetical protein U9R29_11170 [Thermodesulfobacteriota bacterium]|nr:hypothetical protein [Thermodesulfobacteriota bacterium]
MSVSRRIILLPGLAADERMYGGIGTLQVPLLTPRLLIPERNETMAEYAQRHADWLDVGTDDLIGGCSFGSMVASEICRQRATRGLVLLSGALSSTTLVSSSHRLKCIADFIPFMLMRRVLMCSLFLHAVFGDADPAHIELGRVMIKETPRDLLVLGGKLAANYYPTTPIECDIFSLHGALDRVLIAPDVHGGEVVKDAGHGMVVSHAGQVAEFLRRVIAAG